jgi:beta-xylosidase
MAAHALCRPDQLDLNNATTKVNNAQRKEVFTAGLYAPTLRYHDGVFYIICTNLLGTEGMASHEDFVPRNFLITCRNLHDPDSFSDPKFFDFHGIDPSLLFDDDGRVYLQGSFIHGYRQSPATVIRQAEIDVNTGALKSNAVDIWSGSGGKVPEGPHLYKKDGTYYLLIAEGGTHRGHKITMARSSNVWGPYSNFEQNPVLTSVKNHVIQCVGHGELFQDVQGDWWCCMLARREHGSSYPLGRETFLVPVEWPNGQFPQFTSVELEQRYAGPATLSPPSDDKKSNSFSLSSKAALYLRTPDPSMYRTGETGSYLLKCSQLPLGALSGSPTFVGQRQTSLTSRAEVVLNLHNLPGQSQSGLAVYKDPFRYVSLLVTADSSQLQLVANHLSNASGSVGEAALDGARAVRLIIESSITEYKFLFSITRDGDWSAASELGRVSCSDMSGDDFTGKCHVINTPLGELATNSVYSGTIFNIFTTGQRGEVEFLNFVVHEE